MAHSIHNLKRLKIDNISQPIHREQLQYFETYLRTLPPSIDYKKQQIFCMSILINLFMSLYDYYVHSMTKSDEKKTNRTIPVEPEHIERLDSSQSTV